MKNQVKLIIDTAKEKILEALPESDVNVEVIISPEDTIPELGISGRFTKGKNLIEIFIDTENPHLKANKEAEVVQTLAHEYMHATREQKIPWENSPFLEHLVSEGLAQCFEMEILETNIPPMYASSLSRDEIDEYWKKARDILHISDYNYNAWFFGSEEQGIKRWAAYSLGFWLVRKHMIKTGKKASELVYDKADLFIN